eukprot:12135400-Heterocapsa_arctica.AAC.1
MASPGLAWPGLSACRPIPKVSVIGTNTDPELLKGEPPSTALLPHGIIKLATLQHSNGNIISFPGQYNNCLLYTSDAADE